MSIPNIGPELPPDSTAPEGHRKGNHALVYRDDTVTGEVESASARASVVTHRFGGIRYALKRRIKAERPWPATERGETDESE